MGFGRGFGRGRRGRGRGRGGRGRGGGAGSSLPRRNSGNGSSLYGSQIPESQPIQARRSSAAATNNAGIPGWNVFFPSKQLATRFQHQEYLELFKSYFFVQATILARREMTATLSLSVDWQKLVAEPMFEDLPLATEFRDQPDEMLRCMGLAVYQVIREVLTTQLSQSTNVDEESLRIPFIFPRVFNYTPLTSMKVLKANYIGKFICVKGTVVRVGNIKPLVTNLAFVCGKCTSAFLVEQPDGRYTLPLRCDNPECRSKFFSPDRSSDTTETIDFQSIRVQEIMEDETVDSGRIPRTLECELTNDLVDACVPGDIIVITGEVKVVSTDESSRGGKQRKEQALFLLYLLANSVTGPRTLKNLGSEEESNGEEASNDMVEFTLKDLYAIQQIQDEPDVFKALVNSLCPSIYGHELVKAGMLLGLFGGRQKFKNDVNRIPVRGDPHILVVGDPGLGKSQMLRAVVNLAPRGVYVCGNTTTTAGLTVSLHKDGPGGDYALEAGALVLGDQGCCCIDEFDKMGQQHSALLEAMEQQCISIAKAGIVCTLPARTSIIAAANPVGGHYDKSRTVSENLKMNGALLSRFDLVFILLDQADENMDRLLSAHVMSLHSSSGRRGDLGSVTGRRAGVDGNNTSHNPEDDDHHQNNADCLRKEDLPLSKRLQLDSQSDFTPIPQPLLRKYLSYARKYAHPKLNAEAQAVLQTFYLELRSTYRSPDSTPITTRQVESLVRLSEARARLELREEVTAEDATDVVILMKSSMMDTYTDDMGVMDFQRSQHGSGMSKKAQAKRFIAELGRRAEETYNSLFGIAELRKVYQTMGFNGSDFLNFIDSLNNQGFLLQKGNRSYQLRTSEF